jgi:hypothetical protein
MFIYSIHTHTHTHIYIYTQSLPQYGCTHTTFMLLISMYAHITHKEIQWVATAIEINFKIPSLILLAQSYINLFTDSGYTGHYRMTF